NARWGHCLLDLTKPLIGKFEVDAYTGEVFWNNPGFPLAFVDEYRKALASEKGWEFEDAEWREGFSAAMLFGTFWLIGKLFSLGDPNFKGCHMEHLKEIFTQIEVILKDECHWPEVLLYFRRLTHHINNQVTQAPVYSSIVNA
ncbi:MAG: hypothetical protein AAF570_11770, partial [Bacteroidota bacterium]